MDKVNMIAQVKQRLVEPGFYMVTERELVGSEHIHILSHPDPEHGGKFPLDEPLRYEVPFGTIVEIDGEGRIVVALPDHPAYGHQYDKYEEQKEAMQWPYSEDDKETIRSLASHALTSQMATRIAENHSTIRVGAIEGPMSREIWSHLTHDPTRDQRKQRSRRLDRLRYRKAAMLA